jgi:hypothetical protein
VILFILSTKFASIVKNDCYGLVNLCILSHKLPKCMDLRFRR